MASTLTYGFVKPATGDKGSVFWPALEGDIQQINDHTHDGNDSALITAASSRAVTTAISNVGWGSDLGGTTYRQLVTLPATLTAAGGTFDDFAIQLRVISTGEVVYGAIVKVSASTFYVYVNDNSLALVAIFT